MSKVNSRKVARRRGAAWVGRGPLRMDTATERMNDTISTSGSKRKKRGGVIAAGAVTLAIVSYAGGCSAISNSRNKAFEAVQIGETEADVIDRFGTAPSMRETPAALFSRYASQACTGSCVERLWFENRLTFDTEAWSVELDHTAHVIRKAHWVSP